MAQMIEAHPWQMWSVLS